jgi:hypothetical protein
MKIEIIRRESDTVRVITTESGRTITQKAVADCERCSTDASVPHFMCLYGGNRMGHSESHCTASACY